MQLLFLKQGVSDWAILTYYSDPIIFVFELSSKFIYTQKKKKKDLSSKFWEIISFKLLKHFQILRIFLRY